MIQKLESDLASQASETENIQRQYDEAREKRMEEVAKIEALVASCNDLIDAENIQIGLLEESRKSKSEMELQSQKAKASNAECLITVGLYNEFVEQHQDRLDAINNRFKAQWDSYETSCSQWSTKELVIWLRYDGLLLGLVPFVFSLQKC